MTQMAGMHARIRSLEASLTLVQARHSTLEEERAAIEDPKIQVDSAKTVKVQAAVVQLEQEAAQLRMRASTDATSVAQLEATAGRRRTGLQSVVEFVLVKLAAKAVVKGRVEMVAWREKGKELEVEVRNAQAEDEKRATDKAAKQKPRRPGEQLAAVEHARLYRQLTQGDAQGQGQELAGCRRRRWGRLLTRTKREERRGRRGRWSRRPKRRTCLGWRSGRSTRGLTSSGGRTVSLRGAVIVGGSYGR